MNTSTPETETIRNYVRSRYGAIAEQGGADCGCAPTCCTPEAVVKAPRASSEVAGCCAGPAPAGGAYGEKLGYTVDDFAAVPAGSDLGLGCGNPVAIAGIQAGEVVLDLGSGAGFDCFLAARKLAGTGKVIGVDMTAAMITKARANAVRSEFRNVEFRLGEIEALPVADAAVDLILSNCVINLSPEKDRVFREAFRVLKPGGRLAIADVVATKPVPAELRDKLASIGACVGGATLVTDLRELLKRAGFSRVDIQVREASRAMIGQWTEDEHAGEFVVSGFITAFKPAA